MLLLLLGCAPDVYTLVGTLDETDAWIGVAVEGDSALAYVAGGEDTLVTHSRWFTDADLFSTELRDEVNGWTFEASVTESGATGTLLSPEDELFTFELLDTGVLFDAADSGCRDGAVMRPGDGGLELQGVWCDTLGSQEPVIPVTELAMDLELLEVQVETDAGLRAFDMGPVRP